MKHRIILRWREKKKSPLTIFFFSNGFYSVTTIECLDITENESTNRKFSDIFHES